nr:MAG TPA: hypothetical protein [Caudoviricetes sp.]
MRARLALIMRAFFMLVLKIFEVLLYPHVEL